MFPVYLITCTHPKYGQYVWPYVGVVLTEGKTVEKRFQEHLRNHGGAPYLMNAIQKYGKEWFQIEQIDAGNTPAQALDLEKWWIKRLGTKRPTGYNLTEGGDGTIGYEHTPETVEKMRLRASTISEDTRAKMSEAGKARCTAEERAKRAQESRQRGTFAALNRLRTGKPLSEDHRLKLSEVRKGNTNNLGNKATKGTREKMRLAHLGKSQSPEWIAKRSAAKREFHRKQRETNEQN